MVEKFHPKQYYTGKGKVWAVMVHTYNLSLSEAVMGVSGLGGAGLVSKGKGEIIHSGTLE